MQDDIHRHLSRYLDGELPPEDARAVAQKIRDDETWRNAWQQLKTFDALARETYPRTEFTPPVQAARPRRRVALAAAIAAALALFVGLGYAALRANDYTPEDSLVPDNDTQSSLTETASPAAPQSLSETDKSTATTEASTTKIGAGSHTWSGLIQNADGEAIAGARIALNDGTNDLANTQTNAEGRFGFPLEGLTTNGFVTIAADGYQPERFDLTPLRGASLQWEITLAPAIRASGRVVNEDREPVAGAKVTARGLPKNPFTTTDADGRFELTVEDHYDADVAVSHPDYAYTEATVVAGTENEIILTAPGALRVTLTSGGQPVRGTVRLNPSGNVDATNRQRNVDDSGEAVFTNLAPGTYSAFGFTARSDLAQPSPAEVQVRAGEIADIEVKAPDSYPAQAVLRLELPPDVPHPDIAYLAEEWWPDRPRTYPVPEDGVIRAPLSFGRTKFSVAVGEATITDEFNISTNGETIERFYPYRPEDSENARWLRVRIVDRDGFSVPRALINTWGMRLTPTIHNLYTIPSNETFVLARENRWRIAAWDPESGTAGIFKADEHFDESEATLVLDTPATFLTGHVNNDSGDPVPNASVRVYSREREQPFPGVRALTDSTGFFRVGPIYADVQLILAVDAAGYVPLWNESVRESPATLTLDKLHLLVGQILDATGAPAAYAHVTVYQNGEQLDYHETDGHGRFALPVPSGTYDLQGTLNPAFAQSAPLDDGAEATAFLRVPLETDWVSVTFPRSDDTPVVLRLPADLAGAEPGNYSEHDARANNLKMLGLSLKMFANESRGEVYPELAKSFGVFSPNFDQLYPEYVANASLLDPFRVAGEIQYVYLGYALGDEASGLAFLDAYEQLGPAAIAGNDIEVGPGRGSAGQDTIVQLREGIERIFVDTPDDATARALGQSSLPVIWEMPDANKEAWVLYMDGHAERLRYPDDFPMTEPFIERLRQLMRPAP